TAFFNDPNGGPLTYAFSNGLLLDPNNRFAIDPTTGIVTLADHTVLGAAGTVYNVKVQATDGLTTATSADIPITVTNDTPIVDLDASVPNDTGYSASFTEDVTAALAISNSNITITDAASSQLVSAKVTLTNAKTGDSLVANHLSGGKFVDTS